MATPTSRATTSAVVGLCAYEVAAITTGRLPTVTALCRRFRWMEAALIGLLLTHLHAEIEAAAESVAEAIQAAGTPDIT